MRRTASGLSLLFSIALAAMPRLASAAPDPSQKGAARVRPEAISVPTDELHDAVANPSIGETTLHGQAAALFENIERETPVMRPAPRLMDREPVDGHVGTIDGMIETAKQRYDHYRLKTTEVPDQGLANAIGYAKVLRADKRADFERGGKMAENTMGEFVYELKDKLDGGVVEINGRMALMATRIGEAFSYATLVHEAGHAKARSEGRLSPEHVIDGEVEAYRVEYHWLTVIDPSAERIIVLHSGLKLLLERHPDDEVTRASIAYLEHLLELWDTGGEEDKLRDMIKRLGYEDGDKNRPGGLNAASSSGPRV